MADFDLIVRGGILHDGLGSPARRADLAVRDGLIAAIGTADGGWVEGGAREEVDARDCIVTPGFVDVHTHYDGQVMWANRLAPSSNHGVTTVVTGNCGVGSRPAVRPSATCSWPSWRASRMSPRSS